MIELHNISKVFTRKGRQITALQDISLRVAKGEIFGIIGYSGAGKSTLLRVVNALETPSRGEVRVHGRALNYADAAALRTMKKDIGMIFQHFSLLNSKTVWANVAMPLILLRQPKATIETRVAELLAYVGLSDRANSYPNELSGGQKQRVGIARALATNPSILLCDEATSALDPQTTGQILQLLQHINREYRITILLITHEMSVIQNICHQVAVMEQGRIIEQGSVLSVFGHPTHPTTVNFVRSVIQDQLPASVQQRLAALPNGYLLRLEFVGNSARQPVINQAIRQFDIEFNILFASMSDIQETLVGFMMVHLHGPQSQNAIAFLQSAGVVVQEVSHV